MAVELTEAAVRHVFDHAPGNLHPTLRFGVKKTGCSGWSYLIDFTDGAKDGDEVFELDCGIRVVIEKQALPLVSGTKIDFVKNGFRSEFVFSNPNVKAACGCGESFVV